ncbi:hypothetical protein EFY79_17620 [Hanamia caeni]|jgi:WD40 repeat protein|uniref:Uncharacterized protein n=2 Tax=Hanamia caeni TaxID=2294116 RepID=A0A3M9N7Q8_9BACT|nr:hypothetical protein EFY79_17620 [Hanamia caeni]
MESRFYKIYKPNGIKKKSMKANNLPLPNGSPILSLAYNSELNMLAVGQMGDSKNKPNLSLWNPFEKKVIKIIEENAYQNIWALCFSYQGKHLVYSDKTKLFIYDISSDKKHEFKTDNSKIIRIISSKASPMIIVTGKYVEVIDIDSGENIWKFKGYQAESQTKNLEIQKLPAEWKIKTETLSYVNEPATVEIFDDGESVLIGGHNKAQIQQIEISSGKIIKEIFPAPIQGYFMSLGCNETVLAISSKIPYANYLWELETEKRILPEIFNERFGGYSSLCLHPKKRLLLSGSLAGFVSMQKLDDGGFIFSEKLHDGRVSQVAFSNVSKTFFSAGDDGKVRIIETGK